MNRFIVIAFPKKPLHQITEEGPFKGRIQRNQVRRYSFGNNETGANAYATLMHKKNKGHYHVVDQALRATTFRI